MKIRREPAEAFSPFTIYIDVESHEDVQAINYLLGIMQHAPTFVPGSSESRNQIRQLAKETRDAIYEAVNNSH